MSIPLVVKIWVRFRTQICMFFHVYKNVIILVESIRSKLTNIFGRIPEMGTKTYPIHDFPVQKVRKMYPNFSFIIGLYRIF